LTERLVNYKGDVLKLSFLIFLFFLSSLYYPQNATEIVQKANDLVMGKTSQGTNTMTLIRPDWTREVSMKVWSKGIDYYMILITAPAREKGQVFMKRDKEMWNWIPSINKSVVIIVHLSDSDITAASSPIPFMILELFIGNSFVR